MKGNTQATRVIPNSSPLFPAHPNLLAVVTHGGLASTMEAVHYAKPLVGVPFFSDQFQNIQNVVRRGGGLMLDIHHLTEVGVAKALGAVLKDKR